MAQPNQAIGNAQERLTQATMAMEAAKSFVELYYQLSSGRFPKGILLRVMAAETALRTCCIAAALLSQESGILRAGEGIVDSKTKFDTMVGEFYEHLVEQHGSQIIGMLMEFVSDVGTVRENIKEQRAEALAAQAQAQQPAPEIPEVPEFPAGASVYFDLAGVADRLSTFGRMGPKVISAANSVIDEAVAFQIALDIWHEDDSKGQTACTLGALQVYLRKARNIVQSVVGGGSRAALALRHAENAQESTKESSLPVHAGVGACGAAAKVATHRDSTAAATAGKKKDKVSNIMSGEKGPNWERNKAWKAQYKKAKDEKNNDKNAAKAEKK
jgi:hypothetical protein